MSGPLDLTGFRVGLLRVVRQAEPEPNEPARRLGRRWVCLCTGCDRELTRPSYQLMQAMRGGARSACYDCRVAQAKRRAAERRDRYRGHLLVLYRQHHTLWSSHAMGRIENGIRADLERAGFQLDHETATVPIEWHGLGTRRQVRSGMTLAQIGQALGLTRERARQLVTEALSSAHEIMRLMLHEGDPAERGASRTVLRQKLAERRSREARASVVETLIRNRWNRRLAGRELGLNSSDRCFLQITLLDGFGAAPNDQERKRIQRALTLSGGDAPRAAARLKLTARILRRRMLVNGLIAFSDLEDSAVQFDDRPVPEWTRAPERRREPHQIDRWERWAEDLRQQSGQVAPSADVAERRALQRLIDERIEREAERRAETETQRENIDAAKATRRAWRESCLAAAKARREEAAASAKAAKKASRDAEKAARRAAHAAAMLVIYEERQAAYEERQREREAIHEKRQRERYAHEERQREREAVAEDRQDEREAYEEDRQRDPRLDAERRAKLKAAHVAALTVRRAATEARRIAHEAELEERRRAAWEARRIALDERQAAWERRQESIKAARRERRVLREAMKAGQNPLEQLPAGQPAAPPGALSERLDESMRKTFSRLCRNPGHVVFVTECERLAVALGYDSYDVYKSIVRPEIMNMECPSVYQTFRERLAIEWPSLSTPTKSLILKKLPVGTGVAEVAGEEAE